MKPAPQITTRLDIDVVLVVVRFKSVGRFIGHVEMTIAFVTPAQIA